MTYEEAIDIISDMEFDLCCAICPRAYEDDYECRETCEKVKTIDMAIEALQTDVVRCKDCIHSRVHGKTTHWLSCENTMEGQGTDPDGYCYLGERRK